MKLIHCADLHLGANMLSVLPKEKAAERMTERRNTFLRLVSSAKKQGVKGILISGDVFDSDLPTLEDKSFFLSVVENTPEIVFFVLRGNHDRTQTFTEKKFGNLKTFSDSFTSYEFFSVTIGGVEVKDGKLNTQSISFERQGKNILLLHGQVGNEIPLNELKGKNIDYLALGHIHSYQKNALDERGVWAYSGCLEGRGFDECGEKGYVLLDVEEKITATFVPFAARTIKECFVNISSAMNAYEAYAIIKKRVELVEKDYYLIHLRGEMEHSFEKEKEISSYLQEDCYFSLVKDETTLSVNVEDLKGEMSLQGEFIRTVLADGELSEEEKQRVLRYGLSALSGKEVV